MPKPKAAIAGKTTKPHKIILRANACRICGCIDTDCRWCIERSGAPCSWAQPNLCSACVDYISLTIEVQNFGKTRKSFSLFDREHGKEENYGNDPGMGIRLLCAAYPGATYDSLLQYIDTGGLNVVGVRSNVRKEFGLFFTTSSGTIPTSWFTPEAFDSIMTTKNQFKIMKGEKAEALWTLPPGKMVHLEFIVGPGQKGKFEERM